MDQSSAEIHMLRHQINDLERYSLDLRARLNTEEQHNKELQSAIADILQTKINSDNRIIQLEKNVSELMNDIKSSQELICLLEKDLSYKNELVSGLSEKVTEQATTISILDTHYTRLEDSCKTYCDTLASTAFAYKALLKTFNEINNLCTKHDTYVINCTCQKRAQIDNFVSVVKQLYNCYIKIDKDLPCIPLYSMLEKLGTAGDFNYILFPEEFIKKYKLVKIINEDECSICLDNIGCKSGNGDLGTTVLQCGHIFHKRCIFKNFLNCQDTCPICRAVYTANIVDESKKQKIKWKRMVMDLIEDGRITNSQYNEFFTRHNMLSIFASVL